MNTRMTAQETEAVRVAVQRELGGGTTWDEIRDLTLADLVARNQDALIDDLFEDHPDDRPHRAEMTALVSVYDRLLGTRRAGELDKLGHAEDARLEQIAALAALRKAGQPPHQLASAQARALGRAFMECHAGTYLEDGINPEEAARDFGDGASAVFWERKEQDPR